MASAQPQPGAAGGQPGFSVTELFKLINQATEKVTQKIAYMQKQGSTVSIGDMFEMQILMNHLSQMSEMSSSVISSSNQSIGSMARNIK